jgi:hypothetical protein
VACKKGETYQCVYVCALKLHVVQVKVKQFLHRPVTGSLEVQAPRCQDKQHMKLVKSFLRTGHLYPGNIPGTHFC